MLLKDKVALVTGSGRGIGRAMARLFAQEGASVFLCARSESELAAVAAEIGKSGPAGFVTADLTREQDCAHLVSAACAKFGKIDILVNNAGHYGPVVPVEEYPLAEFDSVIAVHLRAAFLLSKLVLPEMYARGYGVILNISSLSAKSAFPCSSPYSAAESEMLGLTRVTAAEAAKIFHEHKDGLGLEVIVPHAVPPSSITRIYSPSQVLGWRIHPEAKGKKPFCGCKYCNRGEINAYRVITERRE